MTLKQERMAEQIRSILSEMLRTEVRDPRLKHVTITRVELDREILYADVHVNALGDESRRDEVLEGLSRAAGFLRSALAARVRLRQTPELHFHWDLNLAHGEHMNRLLDGLEIPPASEAEAEDDEA
ncbi:MAG: 30S ribosome-binding factor RbfA [Anaerolineae bacterium]|nr:30S ribosome-binding factor RbfA [Anaerolineae bacterium]